MNKADFSAYLKPFTSLNRALGNFDQRHQTQGPAQATTACIDHPGNPQLQLSRYLIPAKYSSRFHNATHYGINATIRMCGVSWGLNALSTYCFRAIRKDKTSLT
jgi:hypothetical protein